jgi:hypothetical protein
MHLKNPNRASVKRVPRPAVIDPNQRYSLAETHAALGHSHSTTFKLIREGKLQTLRSGRRRFVSGAEIIRVSNKSSL